MARSRQEAQQELERLQSMYRSLPDQKDDAAQSLAAKIKDVEEEIAGGPKQAKGGDLGLIVWALLALLVGALAFAGAYFGGTMMQS